MSAYPPKVFALKAAMSMPYWRWKRRLVMQKTATIVALALGCALTGCTVGPKYHAPVTQAPPAFTAPPAPPEGNGQWTIAQPQDTAIRGNWWELFNDQELNSLEDQLNVNNQSIKVAFENYMEARALVGEARALYFPTLTANPAYTRSRSSGNLTNAATTTGSGGVTANGGRQSSVYSLPATISWQPDLWGKVRNEVHAAEYTAQMDAADLANEKLSEQADLAEYFFELRGQDALEKLYNDTVAADQKALDLGPGELRRRNRRLYHGGRSEKHASKRPVRRDQPWRSAVAIRTCDRCFGRQACPRLLDTEPAPRCCSTSHSHRSAFTTFGAAPGYRRRGTNPGRG